MLILNKNIKDYYDFLCGIYGIDNDIVYDRTNCTILGKEFSQHEDYFTHKKLYNDKKRVNKKRWYTNEKGKDVYGNVLTGLILTYVLEVGYTHYLFRIERYLDDIDDNKVHIDVELVKIFDVEKKKSKAPISLIPCDLGWSFLSKIDKIYSYHMNQEVQNPILKDTYITSYISPNEIYDKVYNYLISIREKPIIDKRTDIQKLESQGFDKKTSFRNIK